MLCCLHLHVQYNAGSQQEVVTLTPSLTLEEGLPVIQFTLYVIIKFLNLSIFDEPKQTSPETICPTSPSSVHRAKGTSYLSQSSPREEELTTLSEKLNYSQSRSPDVISFVSYCILKIILFLLKRYCLASMIQQSKICKVDILNVIIRIKYNM